MRQEFIAAAKKAVKTANATKTSRERQERKARDRALDEYARQVQQHNLADAAQEKAYLDVVQPLLNVVCGLRKADNTSCFKVSFGDNAGHIPSMEETCKNIPFTGPARHVVVNPKGDDYHSLAISVTGNGEFSYAYHGYAPLPISAAGLAEKVALFAEKFAPEELRNMLSLNAQAEKMNKKFRPGIKR